MLSTSIVSRTKFMLLLTVPSLLALGLLSLSTLRVQAIQFPPNPTPSVYTYAVKIVCATDGTIDFRGGGATLGDTDTVLAPADLYQTAVNVFNAGEPTEVNTSVVLSRDFGGSRKSVLLGSFGIEQHDAIEFDCEDFKNAVREDRVAGGTGFLTVRSFNELDVVAVYSMLEKTRCNSGARTVLPGMASGTGCHGAGASMDVEYIKPRVIQLSN